MLNRNNVLSKVVGTVDGSDFLNKQCSDSCYSIMIHDALPHKQAFRLRSQDFKTRPQDRSTCNIAIAPIVCQAQPCRMLANVCSELTAYGASMWCSPLTGQKSRKCIPKSSTLHTSFSLRQFERAMCPVDHVIYSYIVLYFGEGSPRLNWCTHWSTLPGWDETVQLEARKSFFHILTSWSFRKSFSYSLSPVNQK